MGENHESGKELLHPRKFLKERKFVGSSLVRSDARAEDGLR